MPKVLCECGNWINLSDIPSPNQKLMISDNDFDKYWETEIDVEQLYKEMTLIVVCPICERLYAYYNGFDKPPVVYFKE